MSIIEMEKIILAEAKKLEGRLEGKIEGVDLTLEMIALIKLGLSANEISQKPEVNASIVEKVLRVIN